MMMGTVPPGVVNMVANSPKIIFQKGSNIGAVGFVSAKEKSPNATNPAIIIMPLKPVGTCPGRCP